MYNKGNVRFELTIRKGTEITVLYEESEENMDEKEATKIKIEEIEDFIDEFISK